jgi:hypothetical protein
VGVPVTLDRLVLVEFFPDHGRVIAMVHVIRNVFIVIVFVVFKLRFHYDLIV